MAKFDSQTCHRVPRPALDHGLQQPPALARNASTVSGTQEDKEPPPTPEDVGLRIPSLPGDNATTHSVVPGRVPVCAIYYQTMRVST